MLKTQYTDSEARQFEIYFGESLADYWQPKAGFDIVKFDELIGPPDGTSLADAVSFYGERAGFCGANLRAFVHQLMGA